MANKVAYEMIKRHEGVEDRLYLDTKGIPTIGVGRNLRNKGLYPDEIELMYRNDLQDAEEICARLCPTFYKISENRQAALMSMSFMGEKALGGFKKMFAAIARNDWQAAAKEALDSKWRRDVGENRSNEIVELFLKG